MNKRIENIEREIMCKTKSKRIFCVVLMALFVLLCASNVGTWTTVNTVPREYVQAGPDSSGIYHSVYQMQFPAGVSVTNEVATVYPGSGGANLLKNTQWIFMANADTASGQATMNYDAGSTAAPTAGLAVTGGTSGATAKLISVTTATGTWAGNNATGVMTLGACAGCFHDNETVSFTGGTAVVNMPNSATGVGKIQNGSFSVDTDPPPGWTLAASAVLTTEAAGKVGNCLCITEGGAENPYAHQSFTTVVGKTYYFTCYIKAGTEATYLVRVGSTLPGFDYVNTGNKEETAGDWSTSVTRYFTATGTTAYVSLWQVCGAAAGTTMYFDEVSCYEVAPGCTNANSLAVDGWAKDTTLDIYQQHSDSIYTKAGSFYSLKLVPSAQDDYLIYPVGYFAESYWAYQFRGRPVTAAMWILSSTASDICIEMYDGVGTSTSSYHSGGGSFEWIELNRSVSTSATQFYLRIIHKSASPGIAYVSQPIVTFGSSIGAGNYVPEADRWVYLEKGITSQTFHNKTGASGFSDATNSAITLVSDTGGLIGHGCRSFEIAMSCNDVASAGTACYMSIGPVASTARVHDFWVQPYGLPNDGVRYGHGRVACGTAGTYYYTIDATGGSTFDIPTYRYTAAEWR